VDQGNTGVLSRSRIYQGSSNGSVSLDMISDANEVNLQRDIFNFKMDDSGLIYGILKPEGGDFTQSDDFVFRMNNDGSNFEILFSTQKGKIKDTIVIDPR
jgi:hypothetical protein